MALLGNLTGSSQFFNPPAFYNGVATTSLRFDYDSSHYLYRTPGTAGSRRKWTFSFWIKRADFNSSDQIVINAATSEGNGTGSDGNTFSMLYFKYVTSVGWYDFLNFYNNTNGGSDYSEELKRSFRDTTNWYHIVIAVDTTQSTAGNRVKYYVNGELQTSVSQYYAQIPQNYDTYFNMAHQHWIGRSLNNNSIYFNGYMAEINFVDGTQYAASDFGEFKNGIWIAKNPSVTYGTNGYRLQFKQTGTGTASSSTIGADTSGNNNHWTSGNLSAHDVMLDSPENNFATLTRLSFPLAAKSMSEGKLRANGTDHQVYTADRAFPASGKWYWEVNNITSDGSNHLAQYMGVMSSDIFHAEQDVSTYDGGNYVGEYIRRLAGVSWIAGKDNYYSNFNTTTISDGANSASWGNQANSEGILSLALDVDAGTLKYYWNNSLIRTDSTLTANIEYFAHTNLSNSGGNFWSYAYWNFGQDSSFAGTKTAQGNKDGNGNGDFFYAVPSGHLALCTANLPEPTISPNAATQADDHFNTVLYTGNGSAATHTVGFRPNLVWGKKRGTNAQNHWLINDVGDIDKFLSSDTASGESTTAGTTFNATSFTTASNDLYYNNNSPYVVWAWKGNGTGTAVSNSNGSITSTLSANTTAGFSIVTFTGTGSNATVGHGLGSKPEWFLIKNRDASSDFTSYHQGIGATKNLSIHASDAVATSATRFNNTEPTDSVFTVSTSVAVNGSSADYVVYCWSEVEGFSKFGTYIGNGNVNGTFVFTGFRPAWVMIKNTARAADWRINDATRQDINDEGGHLLLANSNSAEITNEYDIDFLSNGFKLKSGDVYENGSGELFIYMAFAEAPFKYANAR